MKKTGLLFLLSLFCLFFAACGSREEKKTVYYLNFKPEIAQVYEKIARDYEEETGVRVKVVTAASNTYEQTLKSEIAKSEAPTIFQVNGPRGYAAWKNYCADLSDSFLAKALYDPALALTDGDKVVGIPYVVEGYGILCNGRIFDAYFALPDRQAEISSREEIDSFADLKLITEDMTLHAAELGIDGVFASTSLQSGEDWRWQSHLANVPFYYEWKEKGISPTGKEIGEIDFSHAENFRNLFDLYLTHSTTPARLLGSKQVADSMAEFALGRCAMVQNGSWAYSQIASVKGNTVSPDDLFWLPLYTGEKGEEKQGLCIGTENYLCINANVSEEKQKDSLAFLEWLFSSEKGKEYVKKELGFLTPFNTFGEEDTPEDPLVRETAKWLSDPEKNNLEWVFTVFPGTAFKEAFGSALLRYAQSGIDWDGVKQTVVDSWKKEAAG